ncbi:MAG: glycosyltransferase [Ferruginibacter sp.]
MHKSTIIGVSSVVLEQYFAFLNRKEYKKYLLYTFGDIQENMSAPLNEIDSDKKTFKLITIGALRYPKNQQYLIKAFEKLKDENFELHIYGEGKLQHQLQAEIDKSGVKVILKGEVKSAASLIPCYDLYVMSSEFEGFSISVLEAMAMQMPLLLSEISSFKEQCDDTANIF